MKSFRKLYESKRRFKLCFFEESIRFWPIVDGWTQKLIYSYKKAFSETNKYEIDYFNDEINYSVRFFIKKDDYNPNNFDGRWELNAWGQFGYGELKSEKNISGVLKKSDVLYEKFKAEGMKKIPEIPDWKRVVNNYEIAYSRKQNKRTVIVKIVNHSRFICNENIGCKISVYNDDDIRHTDREFYEESSRENFKKMMSNINDNFFKK